MSGSGSAVAAIYKKEGERDEAAARLGTKGHALIKTMTRSSPAAY
jgi:4-diphosphocytidyl-2C-methyl-D-erythritol kinase